MIKIQSRESTMTTSHGLLLVMADIDLAVEQDFNAWYEREHLTERMALPGFLRARRFTALEGSPKYLALYDLESPAALETPAYRHLIGAGKSAWTKRMEPQFKNFKRNVYVSIADRQR
jgi:hypothetical protein